MPSLGLGLSLSRGSFIGSSAPAGYNIDYLIVGGGGGGGGTPNVGGGGAGGGGGGILTGTFSSSGVSSVVLTVGFYGAGGTVDIVDQAYSGLNGSNSTLTYSGNTLIAYGGGGGGNGTDGDDGKAGGSGGGGGNDGLVGGAGGLAISGQGNNGRAGDPGPINQYGGGGGGGSPTAPSIPYNGWDARNVPLNGRNYAAGAGGPGFWENGFILGANGVGYVAAGAGGAAGNGNMIPGTGSNGVAGVCILSMLTSKYTGVVTGSPSIQVTGSYTFVRFASSGTYTP